MGRAGGHRRPERFGKTTLLLALLGRLPIAAGDRMIGPGVIVGEMDQARAAFDVDGPLLDAFIAATGLAWAEARSLLAKFGLSAEHVLRSAATLSPGERTRAVLARFAAQGVQLPRARRAGQASRPLRVVCSKPTLDSFEGTLLLVSHDRRLLDAVRITRVISAEGRKARQLATNADE